MIAVPKTITQSRGDLPLAASASQEQGFGVPQGAVAQRSTIKQCSAATPAVLPDTNRTKKPAQVPTSRANRSKSPRNKLSRSKLVRPGLGRRRDDNTKQPETRNAGKTEINTSKGAGRAKRARRPGHVWPTGTTILDEPPNDNQVVSIFPPVLAEAMALAAAATNASKARLSDRDLLARCERIAGEEKARTLATGIALAAIRSKKLHRQQGNHLFEPYVKERWGGFSRNRMTQLIKEAKSLNKANMKRALSTLPPALAKTMAIAAAATGTGKAHLGDGDLQTLCEQVIDKGLTSSLATGIALTIVRAKRLWELHRYSSFDRYCVGVCGFSGNRAGHLIIAARVLENLANCRRFSVLPTNEGQAGEVARVGPDDQIEVWQRVIDCSPKKITPKVVGEQVLAFVRQQAVNTPEEPDPDEAALGDPVAEAHDIKPDCDGEDRATAPP